MQKVVKNPSWALTALRSRTASSSTEVSPATAAASCSASAGTAATREPSAGRWTGCPRPPALRQCGRGGGVLGCRVSRWVGRLTGRLADCLACRRLRGGLRGGVCPGFRFGGGAPAPTAAVVRWSAHTRAGRASAWR